MQFSRPWPGNYLGDAGPYTDDEWGRVMRSFHLDSDLLDERGPIAGLYDELRVRPTTPASMAVEVHEGGAFVHNVRYINTTPVTLPVPANTSGLTRYDRAVLTKDWSAQTVRAELLIGTPGGEYPTLSHSLSVQWQIPLAVITVTTGLGAIAAANITDERGQVGEHRKLLGIGDFETDLGLQTATIDTVPGSDLRAWRLDPGEYVFATYPIPANWGERQLRTTFYTWTYDTAEGQPCDFAFRVMSSGDVPAALVWWGWRYQDAPGINRDTLEVIGTPNVVVRGGQLFEVGVGGAGASTARFYLLAMELYFKVL